MASLTVKVNPQPGRRWSGTLPVEVRDAGKFVLRARGFSDKLIEVPPGRYLVTATLPDGQQAGTDELVEVRPEENKEVFLSLDDIEIPQALDSSASWGDSVRQFVQPIARLFMTQPAALVRGNPFASWLKSPAGTGPIEREPIARSTIDVKFARGPTLLEIATTKDRFTYFAIPVDEDGTTTVRWQIDKATGTPTVKFDFNSPLNSFFDYVQAGLAPQAKSISRPLTREAELHVGQKQESPLQAALAAYVLLRVNELDLLDTATDALLSSCSWLPDALPIRVEYLARRARHDEAIDLLQRLPTRGVPWFRSGVVYAAARAKTYASLAGATGGNSQIEPSAQSAFASLARSLGEIAESLDQSQTTAVFRDLPRLA
jgi:hypothetical protein